MKTLKCDLCEHEEQAQTFEEWMEALKPHYMKGARRCDERLEQDAG